MPHHHLVSVQFKKNTITGEILILNEALKRYNIYLKIVDMTGRSSLRERLENDYSYSAVGQGYVTVST